MKVRAALFDMDGVLFDSMPIHARCWHQAMQHFGLHLPEEEAYLHEGRTGADTINIVMQRQWQRTATEEECQRMYEYKSLLFNQQGSAPPMPYAYELLQQVKQAGLTILIVTGSGQSSLLSRLDEHFPGIFHKELMVTAFDVKRGKPDPEPYLMGLAKAGQLLNDDHAPLNPHEAIVIENAPLGVRAAVAAGIYTIAVNTGPVPDEALLTEGASALYPSMQALANGWHVLWSKLNDPSN